MFYNYFVYELSKYTKCNIYMIFTLIDINLMLIEKKYEYNSPIIYIPYNKCKIFNKKIKIRKIKYHIHTINNERQYNNLIAQEINIIGLVFGDMFDYEIQIFPKNLKILSFGYFFNKKRKAGVRVLKSPASVSVECLS